MSENGELSGGGRTRDRDLHCRFVFVRGEWVLVQANVHGADGWTPNIVAAAAPNMLEALRGLVEIIDAAGLLNLSNGVQLGQTSWYVKASDHMEAARAAIAKATSLSTEESP